MFYLPDKDSYELSIRLSCSTFTPSLYWIKREDKTWKVFSSADPGTAIRHIPSFLTAVRYTVLYALHDTKPINKNAPVPDWFQPFASALRIATNDGFGYGDL